MLRPADDDDLVEMREWRNQDANREMSLQQHHISVPEHQDWWARVNADPTRRVLVYEADGRSLGVVNFFDLDLDQDTGSWGFYLDNERVTADGTAFLAWMQIMREAISYAFAARPQGLGLELLEGEVLSHNESVRMMNKRFGFEEREPEVREQDGRTVTVIPISLHRKRLRPDRVGA